MARNATWLPAKLRNAHIQCSYNCERNIGGSEANLQSVMRWFTFQIASACNRVGETSLHSPHTFVETMRCCPHFAAYISSVCRETCLPHESIIVCEMQLDLSCVIACIWQQYAISASFTKRWLSNTSFTKRTGTVNVTLSTNASSIIFCIHM